MGNDIPNGIGMIYRLCRYDILHRSMIYFRVSENEIKKPSPEGEGGPLAVDEV